MATVYEETAGTCMRPVSYPLAYLGKKRPISSPESVSLLAVFLHCPQHCTLLLCLQSLASLCHPSLSPLVPALVPFYLGILSFRRLGRDFDAARK